MGFRKNHESSFHGSLHQGGFRERHGQQSHAFNWDSSLHKMALWSRRRRERTVGDQRRGSRPYRADQALGARTRPSPWASHPEGDDGDGGGEGLMGQSRRNVAIDRASDGAATSARASSPSMQPLALEVSLRTSGPLRPRRGFLVRDGIRCGGTIDGRGCSGRLSPA